MAKENLKIQKYPCVYLKTLTERALRPGKAVSGQLTMEEEDEVFNFEQCDEKTVYVAVRPRDSRNEKLFDGEYLSLTQKKGGAFHISCREIVDLPYAKRKFASFAWGWYQEAKEVFKIIYAIIYGKLV